MAPFDSQTAGRTIGLIFLGLSLILAGCSHYAVFGGSNGPMTGPGTHWNFMVANGLSEKAAAKIPAH